MNQSDSRDSAGQFADLRTRIAAVLYSRAMSRLAWHRSWDDLQSEVQQMWLEDADAVIAELTEAIPPIVATAIQGFAQSELAAMSYHGGSKDAFELMEKMNREALQIARYATTHKDWND